jgi:Thymidylate synthase complementing protein
MNNLAYFDFEITTPDETGLVVVSVTDRRTGFVVRTILPQNGQQTASLMAFAGARYSRSSLSVVDLLKEIKGSGTDANAKLGSIFRAYGHASVADMAQLFAYIENVPRFFDMKFFYETSIGGGQARSSRFQDYSQSQPWSLKNYTHPEVSFAPDLAQLDKDFIKLQQQAFDSYTKYKEIIQVRFQAFYAVDTTDKKQLSALKARTLDTARYFLPHGTGMRTSLCWITSAREWARLIGLFKANHDWQLGCLGEQLETLFAPDENWAARIGYIPEASELIRYTASDETTANSLRDLTTFLHDDETFRQLLKLDKIQFRPLEARLLDTRIDSGLKVIMQNILSVYPALEETGLLSWLTNLSHDQQEKLGRILIQNFNHHQQMGNQFRVNTHSFILTTSIAEASDLNRHRAWGRFMPMFSAESNFQDLLQTGYVLPLYLTEILDLADLRQEFEADLRSYYDNLIIFADRAMTTKGFNQSILLQLLPLGHAIKLWMHGSPKEISYLTKLRVRPGGHINYRWLAFEMAQKTATSSSFLISLGDIPKPDPRSREEFLDRS